MSTAIYDHVRTMVKSLAPREQLRLVGEIVGELSAAPNGSEPERSIDATEPLRTPYRSLWGALKDLGPAPSAEEIDAARREEWKNFPREDI